MCLILRRLYVLSGLLRLLQALFRPISNKKRQKKHNFPLMFYRKQPDKHFMRAYFVFRRFSVLLFLGAFFLLSALSVNLSYSDGHEDWDSTGDSEPASGGSAQRGPDSPKVARTLAEAGGRKDFEDLSNLFVGCLKGAESGVWGDWRQLPNCSGD